MLAGGTGITPMLQIIAAILRDPLDLSEISLVFANQTEADICCRDELEKLRAAHPKRFRLHYTLDRPPSSGWAGSTGFITPAMLEAHLPPPGPDTVVLCCGPPPMVKFACKANLDKLDYPKDRVLCF
jgi:cytochrome-b5 reductase